MLANGHIVDANTKKNPDLFQALKGGSNNFGIVTRFDLVAFKQGHLWGGVAVYPLNTTSQQLQAFVNFGNNIPKDPFGSLISFWQYSSATGEVVIIDIFDYTKAVVNAPPFDEYMRIPNKTSDTLRITNLTDLTAELEQAYDFRFVSFSCCSALDTNRLLQ